MTEPSIWRTEIWHPLTVHFPIALLAIATVAKIIALFLNQHAVEFWQRAGSYLLYVGTVTAWISIFTGDNAEGIVNRTLCDPTMLKEHEILAYYMAYAFSAASVIDLALRLQLVKFKVGLIKLSIVLLMITGTGFLVYTGHLGAQVVYQQAGGVHVPSSNCAEFEG